MLNRTRPASVQLSQRSSRGTSAVLVPAGGHTPAAQLFAQPRDALEPDRIEAKRGGRRDVLRTVVDVDALRGGAADTLEQQPEDRGIGLDQADVGGDENTLKPVEEGKAPAREREGLGRPVGQRVQ